MKNIKKFSVIALMIISMVLVATSALALIQNDLTVRMDDRPLDTTSSNPFSFEKDDEFDVRVTFSLDGAVGEVFENVQVEARIRGYDQRDIIEDISNAFDASVNTTYTKDLSLKIPVRMDDGLYQLRITISDANGAEIVETYSLDVDSDSHGIWIKDVVLSPENEVQAGRALLATVRVKNIGDKDENEGIRVKVSVPTLGLSATDYIDEILADEAVTSEELYMRIPQCAELGMHDVKVEITYNDGDYVETEYVSINVVGGELCEANNPIVPVVEATPVITVGVDVQNVVSGAGGAIYPITITNAASVSKTFTLIPDVESSWATVRVSPSNVLVIEPGQTETAYVYLSAKEGALLGQNIFAVTVKSGANAVEQFTLTANVVPNNNTPVNNSDWSSVRNTLEIGLVVLVIILVILGLVIGLRKMKKDDGEGDDAQTYY